MNFRYKTALLLLAAASLLAAVTVAFSQDKFKLKPGAEGKLCLGCHVKFQEKLQRPFVHTPVKSGACSDCHNPHTSSHGKLLAADAGRICVRCHEGIIPAKAQSTHKVVLEGNCVKCHDPHSADNKYNLNAAGNELCFSCHKGIADAVARSKYKHNPVEKGCLNCHDPHASTKSALLLKTNVPVLCTNCHNAMKPAFARQHMNYPVAGSRCTSCHDPHGSSQPGMMWGNVHPPVANRMCAQCHQDSSSPDALKTKRQGYDLCRGCHNDMVNETFDKKRVHWPVLEKAACLNCHNPHASTQGSLIKDSIKNVCGSCHSDVIERQKKSLAKHQPVEEGTCTKCHRPHSADYVFLIDNTSTIGLCGTCHEWQKHSSHPIGEKVVDPRNKSLTLDCSSCHRSHGTEFKYFLHFDSKMDLCVQCHEKFKR